MQEILAWLLDRFQSFRVWVGEQLAAGLRAARGFVDSALDWVRAQFASVWEWVREQLLLVYQSIKALNAQLRQFFEDRLQQFSAWINDVAARLQDLVATRFLQLQELVATLLLSVRVEIYGKLNTLTQQITGLFSGLFDIVQQQQREFEEWRSRILWEWIENRFAAYTEMLLDVFQREIEKRW